MSFEPFGYGDHWWDKVRRPLPPLGGQVRLLLFTLQIALAAAVVVNNVTAEERETRAAFHSRCGEEPRLQMSQTNYKGVRAGGIS